MRKLLNSHTEHTHEHNHNAVFDIKNTSFKYKKNDTNILNEINVEIHRGCFTTIIGANGSGKSTLVKLLVKLNKLNSGLINFNGVDIDNIANKIYSQKVAYIPQSLEIPHGITVYDFVSYGRIPYLGTFGTLTNNDKVIIENSMHDLNIYDWKDKMMNELSGGQKQRILIAMCLAQQTDIIIVDEPTTYLDIKSQYEILELLDKLHDSGKTIIAVLHDINQALQYSDEIIAMKNGKIHKYGLASEVVDEKLLRDIFEIDAKMIKSDEKKFVLDIKLIK